jgi:hypothetical protein
VNVADRVSGIRFTWLHKAGGMAGVEYVFDFIDKLARCTALVGPDGVLLQTGMKSYMNHADEVCRVLHEAYKVERAQVDPDYARARGLAG